MARELKRLMTNGIDSREVKC
nr:hypothetical protein [Orientia tsutsugamushi]